MNYEHKIFSAPKVQEALDVLDSRQRTFVIQATVGQKSPTGAAKAAGFSAIPKSRAVRCALNAMHVELARELDFSLDDVKRGMLEAVHLSRTKGEPMSMIAAWREIGKLSGYYDQEHHVEINIEKIEIKDMEGMSSERLRELIAMSPEVLEGEFKRVESSG